MFEQSLVSQTHRKPWAMGVSLTMETAFVGALILWSVLHVDKLPPVDMHIMVPYPRTPDLKDAVKIVGHPEVVQRSAAITMPRPLVAPTHIPDRIAVVEEDLSIGSAPQLGSASGIQSPLTIGAGTGLLTEHAQVVPPPPLPKPVESAPRKPMLVSSGVAEAMILKRVIPAYPPLAKAMRVSGRVHLTGVIGKDGTIQNLQVVDGHPLLVKAAVDAVRQWIYRPTTLNGEPVDVIAPIEVNFVLQ